MLQRCLASMLSCRNAVLPPRFRDSSPRNCTMVWRFAFGAFCCFGVLLCRVGVARRCGALHFLFCAVVRHVSLYLSVAHLTLCSLWTDESLVHPIFALGTHLSSIHELCACLLSALWLSLTRSTIVHLLLCLPSAGPLSELCCLCFSFRLFCNTLQPQGCRHFDSVSIIIQLNIFTQPHVSSKCVFVFDLCIAPCRRLVIPTHCM